MYQINFIDGYNNKGWSPDKTQIHVLFDSNMIETQLKLLEAQIKTIRSSDQKLKSYQ